MPKTIVSVWYRDGWIKVRSLDGGTKGNTLVGPLTRKSLRKQIKREERNLRAHGYLVVPRKLFKQLREARFPQPV